MPALSAERTRHIHQAFMDALPSMGQSGHDILRRLALETDELRTLLEYYYGTMPASDIGNTPYEIYRDYAESSLRLLKFSPWSPLIPEDVFLPFVAHYRINNEGIEACRSLFHASLADRLTGKGMREAALEVNLWCAEHMTYQSTDDRTISPLGAYLSAYGRCGEESTFVVSVLRSVGLPARQVYAPRWSHCDDNHAWAEVWCEGEWHYLGACEPEPVLNLGWFNDAAARSMMMDTKVTTPPAGEEAIPLPGQRWLLNETARYAETRRFTVTVTEDCRTPAAAPRPAAGVQVRFEVLNGAELYPVLTMETDGSGQVSATLGLGSLHIHACRDGRFLSQIVDTHLSDYVTLDFSHACPHEDEGSLEFSFFAPEDSDRNTVLLSDPQKEQKRALLEAADRKRHARAADFFDQEKAARLASQYPDGALVLELLRAAEGNFGEIHAFLSMDFRDNHRMMRLELLKSLSRKDLRDVRSHVLADHFQSAMKLPHDLAQEIFIPHVLCPRIHHESLSPYRSRLADTASALSIGTPEQAWTFAEGFTVPPSRDSGDLPFTPEGALRCGQANELGRRTLFVALCRTLGFPARLNPVDQAPEVFRDGHFCRISPEVERHTTSSQTGASSAFLTLEGGAETWSWMHNWTLGYLENGQYRTLSVPDTLWRDGRLFLTLQPGHYRILTSNRTPGGNQFALKTTFHLKPGENRTLALRLRQLETADLLEQVSFPPFVLRDGDHRPVPAETLAAHRPALLIWLEEGREPTEHILNECIAGCTALASLDCEKVFILRDPAALANKTLQRALAVVPGVRVLYDDFAVHVPAMARRMFVNQEMLPLTVVMHQNRGVYGCSGYNVGVVDLLMRIVTAATSSGQKPARTDAVLQEEMP